MVQENLAPRPFHTLLWLRQRCCSFLVATDHLLLVCLVLRIFIFSFLSHLCVTIFLLHIFSFHIPWHSRLPVGLLFLLDSLSWSVINFTVWFCTASVPSDQICKNQSDLHWTFKLWSALGSSRISSDRPYLITSAPECPFLAQNYRTYNGKELFILTLSLNC